MSKLNKGDILLVTDPINCTKNCGDCFCEDYLFEPFTIFQIADISEKKYQIIIWKKDDKYNGRFDWIWIDKEKIEYNCVRLKTEELL